MAKENLTLYCADIHGYGYLLDKVINYFHKMPSDTKLVFIGDTPKKTWLFIAEMN